MDDTFVCTLCGRVSRAYLRWVGVVALKLCLYCVAASEGAIVFGNVESPGFQANTKSD